MDNLSIIGTDASVLRTKVGYQKPLRLSKHFRRTKIACSIAWRVNLGIKCLASSGN